MCKLDINVLLQLKDLRVDVIFQVYLTRKYTPTVILPYQYLNLQACLLQQPSFLQNALAVVIQQSRYSIFHDRNTSI